MKLKYKVDGHTWYTKIQVQNQRYPVRNVAINDPNHGFVNLHRTEDGHFYSGNTNELAAKFTRPFAFPMEIKVCDVYGQCVSDSIAGPAGVFQGTAQLPTRNRLLR